MLEKFCSLKHESPVFQTMIPLDAGWKAVDVSPLLSNNKVFREVAIYELELLPRHKCTIQNITVRNKQMVHYPYVCVVIVLFL